jgi:hypothetical protein
MLRQRVSDEKGGVALEWGNYAGQGGKATALVSIGCALRDESGNHKEYRQSMHGPNLGLPFNLSRN